MCGRAYATYDEEEIFARYHSVKLKRHPLLGLKPNYNLAPTQKSLVLFIRDREPDFQAFRWGLVPFWAKDVKSAEKYSLINAKSEEVEGKRSYKDAFRKRRCILPLSGFYEWQKDEEGSKRPFAVHMKDNSIMSVAGIWEEWVSQETGEVIDSFSILTTEANSMMAKIHERMPVILDRKDELGWLDPENQDVLSLKKLLNPCPSLWLDAYQVSTRVNSPRNNSADLLIPIA